jgi:hypothetical protein
MMEMRDRKSFKNQSGSASFVVGLGTRSHLERRTPSAGAHDKEPRDKTRPPHATTAAPEASESQTTVGTPYDYGTCFISRRIF